MCDYTQEDGEYSPEEFARRMRIINEDTGTELRHLDIELSHIAADELMVEFLCHLGYEEGCRVFESMDKWYS